MRDRKSITAKKQKGLWMVLVLMNATTTMESRRLIQGNLDLLVFGFGQSTRSVQWVQGGWYVVLKMSSRVCSKKMT